MYTYLDPNAPAGAGGVTNEQKKALAGLEQRERAVLRNYSHLAAQRTYEKGENPFVEDNLEGHTLKFGTGGEWTYDTGIPINNKHLLSGMIAAGDQIGDFWRGAKQILQEHGLADDLIDIQAQNDNEEIMRQLYGDEKRGTSAMVGGGLGLLAEPVGLLLPIGKAKSLSTAMMGGVGLGFLYGGGMYVDGNESRLMNAIFGAASLGLMSPLAYRYFQHGAGDEVVQRIENARAAEAVEAEKSVYAKWAGQKNRGAAGNINQRYQQRVDVDLEGRVMDDWFDQQVQALDSTSKRKAKARARKDLKMRREAIAKRKPRDTSPEEILEKIETKAAIEGGRHSIAQRSWGIVDKAIRPLYDAVNRLSPRTAAMLRVSDGKQHLLQHQWITRVKPFYQWMAKLPKEQAHQMHKLLSNGGMNKATMTYMQQIGGDVGHAKQVQDVLNDILKRYRDAGYKLPETPDYFPLAVRDLKGLTKKQQGVLDSLYSKEQARRGGKPLSSEDQTRIAEHFFTFEHRFSKTSGSLQKRKKRGVADDELEFYHDPGTALQYYVHTAAEDIAKREFFKEFGVKPKKNGYSPTGSDIDEAIGTLLDSIKKGIPDYEEQNELVRLLRSRFSSDVNKTHRWVQDLKNLSYAGTLGNWWSAMTQIGDLVFAFHKYGVRAAVGSMFGPKVTDRARLGIEKAMAELVSDQRRLPAKLADFAFQWSGFNAVDRFGKNVNINASLRKNQRLAKEKPDEFLATWRNHFGDETEGLMNELQTLKLKKNADLSDNAHLMLWNDLADTQPIGLSEMPELYLRAPNGRLFYAYKTFSMKQFNYMRNQFKNDKNAFRSAYNLTMFATMFVMANGSVDMFKDYMAGRPLNFNDKFFDNLVSLAGTSKYAVDKSQGLGGIILQGLAPVPVTQAGEALDALSTGDVGVSSAVNQLPIVGKMNKEWDILK